VKYILFLASTLAFGQSVATSYSTDLNGNRVANATVVSTATQQTRIVQSINGRKVPMEQSEERVISEGPGGRVVEKITKRFDPTGTIASTERTVTEEEKLPDGLRSRSTTYRTDINGQVHEAERRSTEAHKQGSSESTQSEVARPDVNGSFQPVEKRSSVSETVNNTTHTDQTVYRPSGNGGFYPAVREVSDTTQSGSQVIQKSARYEPRDSQQLQLTAQTVSTTVKRPDGSSVAEVSLYGAGGGDGRVRDNESGLHLREQQTIEQIAGGGGSVTEIVTARRPSVSDPSRMGPPTTISETICTGKCSGYGFMH
jgi:hypothetical protein